MGSRSVLKFVLGLVLMGCGSLSLAHDEHVLVGGFSVRVASNGLEQRRPGEPVIVFENGSTSSLESWGDFRKQAARIGPVIFYDRATVGQSEWDGKLGTPHHVTRRLWSLLRQMRVEPPYVLVGWSWGADLAINHALTHPEDVSGIVLIDPPLHSGKAEIEILERIGSDRAAHTETVARMHKELESAPPTVRADVLPIVSIFENLEDPSLELPSKIAVAGLIAGRRPDPPAEIIARFGPLPYDFQLHLAAKTRLRADRLERMVMASREGAMFLLPQSGHALHLEHPELVLEAIRLVLPKRGGLPTTE